MNTLGLRSWRQLFILSNICFRTSQVVSGSHHLESVPCSTPLAHGRGRMVNRYFACPPDDDDSYRRALENAESVEELVPIRLDMELENIKVCFD